MRNIFSLLVILFFSNSYITGQNWKNHRMTKEDVIQMKAEYEMLPFDESISKFVNDIEYLKIIFPLLYKGQQKARGGDSEFNKQFDFIEPNDEKRIFRYLSNHIKVDQYFTSLKDDTVAIVLNPLHDDNSPITIDHVHLDQVFNDNISDTTYSKVNDKFYLIPSNSLFDSVSVWVDISIPSSVDTMTLDCRQELSVIGNDTIKLIKLSDRLLEMKYSSQVFDRIVSKEIYQNGLPINPDSVSLSSAILNFNYTNSMRLLDGLTELRSTIILDINQYETKESFIGALTSILENFELQDVDNIYTYKIYLPEEVDKIKLYLKSSSVRRKYKINFSLE